MTKKRTFRYYHEYLISSLRENPEEAIEYLNAALLDEDPRLFLVALKNVAEAHNTDIPQLTEDSDIPSIQKALNAVGLGFAIQPREQK